ncbi:secondary thiamine-phosphate synthase enzyme YjbQ [Kordiimonas aquimaris]|uniref:secondary thiamine-phosphate synthase enzyme YjbQ n=1 Tax=Kordiimonas aquimaris TaxID=707591 RepID=UPI0021D377D4|nr:secondary thiamine-phosphate synthase enzyme YjbQ [Kordiimonas aquimaris]
MHQQHETITCNTHGTGLYEITGAVSSFVSISGINDGLLTLLVQHTSASLTIQENADPDVRDDLIDALDRLAPQSRNLYRHTAEGLDDMPAHIKTALTDTSLSIPIMAGVMRLGTWQGIYLAEHRIHPHTRCIAAHIIGL